VGKKLIKMCWRTRYSREREAKYKENIAIVGKKIQYPEFIRRQNLSSKKC